MMMCVRLLYLCDHQTKLQQLHHYGVALPGGRGMVQRVPKDHYLISRFNGANGTQRDISVRLREGQLELRLETRQNAPNVDWQVCFSFVMRMTIYQILQMCMTAVRRTLFSSLSPVYDY
jgi:hypothetical protein